MKLPAALLAGLAGSTLVAFHAQAMSGDGASFEPSEPVAAEHFALASNHEGLALDTTPSPPVDAGAPKPPKPPTPPKPPKPPTHECEACGRG